MLFAEITLNSIREELPSAFSGIGGFPWGLILLLGFLAWRAGYLTPIIEAIKKRAAEQAKPKPISLSNPSQRSLSSPATQEEIDAYAGNADAEWKWNAAKSKWSILDVLTNRIAALESQRKTGSTTETDL